MTAASSAGFNFTEHMKSYPHPQSPLDMGALLDLWW